MQKAAGEQTVYTIEEAARVMKISANHLYILIRKKQGPPIKRLGGRIRISVSSLNVWLNKP